MLRFALLAAEFGLRRSPIRLCLKGPYFSGERGGYAIPPNPGDSWALEPRLLGPRAPVPSARPLALIPWAPRPCLLALLFCVLPYFVLNGSALLDFVLNCIALLCIALPRFAAHCCGLLCSAIQRFELFRVEQIRLAF